MRDGGYKSTDGGATHPSNPNRLVAFPLRQFYVSQDAGDSLVKLKQNVNEISALAWVPPPG